MSLRQLSSFIDELSAIVTSPHVTLRRDHFGHFQIEVTWLEGESAQGIARRLTRLELDQLKTSEPVLDQLKRDIQDYVRKA